MLTDSQGLDLKSSLHLCTCHGENRTQQGLLPVSWHGQIQLLQPDGAGAGRAALSHSERPPWAPQAPLAKLFLFCQSLMGKKRFRGSRTISSQYLSLIACTPFFCGCIYVQIELSLPVSLLSSYEVISYTCVLG